MADVFKILLLVLGALTVIVSYWLAGAALFPRLVEQARHSYEARPVRITVLGAVLALPTAFVGIGLLSGPAAGKLLGAILCAVPLLLALLGSAGLSQRIGRGLPSGRDASDPWRRELRGGVVLALTFLMPLVGWFVVLPWALVSGCGAATSALLARWRERRPHTPVTPIPGATG